MADNKLQSLSEIFNQRFFRIPDFQRGYSWEERQLLDFWDDLENLKLGKLHYTGLLTVENLDQNKVEETEKWREDIWLMESGHKAFYLIDGQQRLTTSIILINEIITATKEGEDLNYKSIKEWSDKFLYRSYKDKYMSYMFGYEKDNPSDEYFKTKILGQASSTSDKVPELTLYTANLEFAKSFFKERIKVLTHEEVNATFKKLVNQFKFNLYEIDDDLDIYVTFETMNNRGKPLSNLELMKNRLIYLSTLLEDDQPSIDVLRKDINETWKTIYEYLGKNKDKRLDDDDFLFNHWIMYFRYDRKESGSYAKYLLNQEFTPRNTLEGKIGYQDIKQYINSLAKSVKSWFYIYNVDRSKYSEETKLWMQRLDRAGYAAFRPLVMAALTKDETDDQIVKLLMRCERFVFLVFRLTQRPTNTKNSHFFRLASDYYQSRPYHDDSSLTTNLDLIISNIEWMTDGESDEGDDYVYHGWYDLDKFYSNMKDAFTKDKGYYSWSAIKYFLYEYEEQKRLESDGDVKRSWDSFDKSTKEKSIEHILPQTPTVAYWQERLDGLSNQEVHRCQHTLGNLVLLARNKNPKQGNRSFPEKKHRVNSKGIEVGFYNGSYSEIEVNQYEHWSPKEILERGIKMLQFMENRWGISLSSKAHDLEDLLQLSFVINGDQK